MEKTIEKSVFFEQDTRIITQVAQDFYVIVLCIH